MVLCLVSLPSIVSAANPRQAADIVWTKNQSRRTGLYTTRAHSIGNSIALSVDALYYFGDMERPGFALKTPHVENLGWGVSVSYLQAMGYTWNLRYSLGGGYMHGDNSKEVEATGVAKRQYEAFNLRGSVGVEWYPFAKAGLYLYGGIQLQYSAVDYKIHNNLYTGMEHCILPIIPLEIGYNFTIKKSWLVGLHIGYGQGLIDRDHLNMDGWPQSGKFGNSKYNQWADGYLQAGITVSYSWHNCETCRLYRW